MKNANALLFLISAAVASSGWFFTFDDTSAPGTGILGGYRDRWFVINVVFSYVALWSGLDWAFGFQRMAWFRIVAAHFAVVMLVVFLELLAVVGIVDYSVAMDADKAGTRAAGDLDPRLRRMSLPNQNIQGKTLPDLSLTLGVPGEKVPFTFETDGFGLRNSRDKRDPQVICLGDSMLVGGYMQISEILTERLEGLLGREVLNVSEVSFSPQEELIRLETTGLDVKDRLIVQIIFEGNDLMDSAAWRTSLAAPTGNSWPKSGLIKQLLGRLHLPRRGAGLRRGGLYQPRGGEALDVYFLYDGVAMQHAMAEYPALEKDLQQSVDGLRADGARYAMVVLPAKLTVLHPFMKWGDDALLADEATWERPFAGRLREFAERNEIPFFDLLPALHSAAENGELPYYTNDTHLNAHGHAVVADTLAPWIAALQD